jgi:hypothetical protein
MIPSFTNHGFLPPFSGNSPADPAGRAPFETSIIDIVNRYATSPERCKILDGLLRYRLALWQIGLSTGFQWIDGSFAEDIEKIENRPPNDIDIVTFYHRPDSAKSDAAWEAFQATNQQALESLFFPASAKSLFQCDAYPVELDIEPVNLVCFTHYWFGLFSHRRGDFVWKGLIQIPLFDPSLDPVARQLLTARAGP